MEVPHVGRNPEGRFWLTYSTGAASSRDASPDVAAPGQLHALELSITPDCVQTGAHRVLLGPDSPLYAGWVAPNGDLVGFSKDAGGFLNLGPSELLLREDRDLLEVDGIRPRWVLPLGHWPAA